MKKTKLFLAVATACVFIHASSPAVQTIPEESKIGGFAVGTQGWTFRKFTVMEGIQKTAEAGAKVIELFPGQKLSSDSDAKFDHNAPPEVIAKVKAQLEKHGIRAVNYGVVGAKDEQEWRKIFEMGKALGLYAITTEAVNQLDTIEKLVKEYDIAVGIHNHPRRPNDANYKVWDPSYVLSVVKDRDSRIGAAADTGHWASSNIKPVDGLRTLKGRIISVHLKDRKEIGKGTPDVVFGSGILDLKSVLDELKGQKFAGNISIEYETNWDNSVPDVGQCVGFFRGYGACQ